jgi:hypothetical protein
MANMTIFPTALLLMTSVWGLVEQILATTLGAWLYRENGAREKS